MLTPSRSVLTAAAAVASCLSQPTTTKPAIAKPTTTTATFDQKCAKLATQLSIENLTVSAADFITAGTNLTLSGVDPSCLGFGSTTYQIVSANVCRLTATVATSSRSGFEFEVWLPQNWSGRFLSTGNGGIGGCIQYPDLDYGISQGFAATATNNGHAGQSLVTALNNPDVTIDYAWRAIYTSATLGKQIVDGFYKKPHDKAYYLGCSTGGRQGFKLAQDFPDIFDGIVAGAPAFDFNRLQSWSGWFHGAIAAAGSDGYPPPATFAAIDAELLAQCDELDGVADGIIEEPSLCNFRPEALICAPGTNSPCITGKQAETVRTVLSDLHGVNGTLVYPRMQPTLGIVASIFYVYGLAPFLFSDHWFRFVVYNDTSLDTSVVTPEQMAFAIALNPGNSETWSGDLSGVANRGAKILHYHGQADNIITSANSNRYYDHVSRTMNLPSGALDNFYRFFRISGMGHCSGGDGAAFIGNVEGNTASLDPNENVLTAMVRWVEEGIAPDTITGTRYVNGTQALGIDYKRAHCRYPLRNVYSGKGDVKHPASWKCI
ncbi:Tannase/feruloyl esterase [Bisporella sp. PMI_857]|nr:Tannase/feruloyl esterase [Bisporella sp. PMI_857]